jgi:hypothetical protein
MYTTLLLFREQSYKLTREIYATPPSQWASERGATHTLWCGVGHGRGTRPVIIKKTRILVGVDETPEGGIKWETWLGDFRAEVPEVRIPFKPF